VRRRRVSQTAPGTSRCPPGYGSGVSLSSALVLLPSCFSQNGLVWPKQGRRLLVGLSVKGGSGGRGSESCGECWEWRLVGVCAPLATQLCRLSAKWGWPRSPCQQLQRHWLRTEVFLREEGGGGGWSLGLWLCAPGIPLLGVMWGTFNGSKTRSSAPSITFCCCQRW